MPDSTPSARLLRFGLFELDTHAGELRKRGVKLRLQGQPLQVLTALVRRAGDLVTREELRAQIWQADTFVDFDHSLHNAVARLREVLGDSAQLPRYVETLPRRGYRFVAHVQPASPQAEDRAAIRAGSPHRTSAIRSLAVLPLEDLSGKPGEDYFADGMTESLITNLAKIKALRVISRTSAMQFKGSRKSLPEIARKLNVDAVMEGSVVRAGERVRINTQLILSSTDEHLWAESYERNSRDILSLQSEIAREVAHQVKIILTPEESARLGGSRQVNPKAHELYLKARYYWNKRTEEGVRKALSRFQQALDLDPTYAHGYLGIADCYNILGYYNAVAPMEAYPKARAAVLKALELDSSLAEAHASLAVIKRDFEWDWAGADREFQRAIELNPGCVEAYHWRSTLRSMLGRHDEAIREKTKALAMDPLSVVITSDLARMFYFARNYEQAVKHYRAGLEMDPNFASAHAWLAQAYQQKGRRKQAISELLTAARLDPQGTFTLARLGHGYALAKRTDDAQDVLRRLKKSSDQYVSPYDVAMIYTALKEYDEAFAWLETALEQRSLWLGYLNVEPQLDPLRSDRRFSDLVRRIGLGQTDHR